MARPQAQIANRGSARTDASASIGRGTRVRGRVEGDGALRVEGEVAGDVRISGSLDIDAGGTVTGNVDASEVTIEGALTGDVTSRGRVAIRAGAQVEGNMAGSEIALEEGASFSGRIDADFELPDGKGTIQMDGWSRWVKLQVGDSPGVPISLVAIGFAVFGLCLSLFVRPRRVWLRVTRSEDGPNLVEVGGLDRADARAGLTEDVEELASTLSDRQFPEQKADLT